MNKKIKGLMLAAGVLAGIGSLMPLTTYQASAANPDNPDTANMTVNVPSVLTLNAVSNVTLTADSTKIVEDTSNFTVNITSNKGYVINMKAESADKAALRRSDAINESIPASGSLEAGKNGWGIKKKTTSFDTDGNPVDEPGYTALTDTDVLYYTASQGTFAAGVSTHFTIGVAVAPSLTAGSYSTTVIVTAVNN